MSALGQSRTLLGLFDHLVGAGEQRRRHGDGERLGSFEVDNELELRGLDDWQVGRLFAL